MNQLVAAGKDVSANQTEEEGDKEVFQLEYHKKMEVWSIRCVDNTLWTLEAVGGIQAGAKELWVLHCIASIVCLSVCDCPSASFSLCWSLQLWLSYSCFVNIFL